MLIKEANYIQNELYKTRKIQAKIQSDIDAVIVISQRFQSRTTEFDLTNALIMLIIGLRDTKTFIAEMRSFYSFPNHYKNPSLINQNPKINPQKLKDLIDSLKYKMYNVKWSSISLVSDSARLRLLRKTMAQTLSEYAGSPVQDQTRAPKQITAPTPVPSLSRLLLAKMNNMVVKLLPETLKSPSLGRPTFESAAIFSEKPLQTQAQIVGPNADHSTLKQDKPNPLFPSTQLHSQAFLAGLEAQNEKTNAGNKAQVQGASKPTGSVRDQSLSKLLSDMNIMYGKLLPETSKSPSFDLPTEQVSPEPIQPDLTRGFGSRSESKPQPAPTQPAQGSEGLKANNDKISEMKVSPQLAKQANDFQNELYRFKVMSRDIEAKIQKDIDAVTSNINFNSTEKEKVQNEWTVKYFLHSLLKLKSKLAKAKADIVTLRKKCQNSILTGLKPELEQSSRQLQQSFNEMLWIESFVRSNHKRERQLIETMARVLCNSNKSFNGFSTSPSTPDQSLSKLLSEMDIMARKLLPGTSNLRQQSPSFYRPTERAPNVAKQPLPTPPLSTKPKAGEQVSPEPIQPDLTRGFGSRSESKPQPAPTQPAQGSEGLKANNDKISEMKVSPQLAKQANDFQNELYRFKVMSRDIEAKIQKDIDTVSNKRINSLEKEKSESSFRYFLHALLELKSKLAKAKADVAVLRNKCQLPIPTSVKPELDQTSRQLKQAFNEMLCRESFVRSNLQRERLLIEALAQALCESNKSMDGLSTSQNPSEKKQTEQTSRTPTPDPETQTKTLAEKKIEAGQEFYELSKYMEAVQMFSEACDLCPASSCYLIKRADALMMLGEHKRALKDAQTAVALDPTTCEAGYVIIANCCFKLGDIEGSEEAVNNAIELFGEASVSDESKAVKKLRSMQEEARNMMEREFYQLALIDINSCLKLSPACYESQLIRAEVLATDGIAQRVEAAKIAHRILPHLDERLLAGAYYVLGLCSYHQGNNEEAIKWFQKIDKPNRYQKKAREPLDVAQGRAVLQKKEKGNQAFENGKFELALQLYTEALDINIDDDHMNATLHYNKATVYAKLNQTRDAEQACTVALHLKPDYIKALERRAQCCTELGEHEDAVEDYTKLVELYKRANLADRNIKRLLRKAEKVLEKFKRVDYYYKILGVKSCYALDKTVRNCYIDKLSYYHPDKHPNAGMAVIARETRRAQRVTEAYNVLGDIGQRASYDLKQNRSYVFTTDKDSSSSNEEDERPQMNPFYNNHFPLLRPIKKLRPFKF